MAISRLFNFLSGTTISSSQMNAEIDQLVGAVNQVQSDDNNKDTILRGIAQLSKITNDNGGVKLSVTDTSKDILNELLNLGPGLHTFYSVSGTVNNPNSSVSIRGIFHQTATGYGWVYAQDSNGISYENYVNASIWKGWKGGQTVLWSGTPVFLQGGQTVTPSKKLSQCKNGWILVWSDYDPGVGSNDYDWNCSYIPRYFGINNNSQSHLWAVPQTPSAIVVKRGNVYDDKIVGHDDNIAGSGNDVVLRYVLEW